MLKNLFEKTFRQQHRWVLMIISLTYTFLLKNDMQQANLLYIIVLYSVKILNRLASRKILYYVS